MDNILIIEDEIAIAELEKDYLELAGFRVTMINEGTKGLSEALSGDYQLVILDLMLPGLDGISLLQSEPMRELRPIVLAVSRFASDYVVESIEQLGVGYLMLKPCDIKATVARIADLSQRIKPPAVTPADNKTRISNTLLTLGIPTKLRGYAYLREAVEVMAQHPGLSITKELYPMVGQRCGASAENVERSIRGAIAAAWENRDDQIWRMYFSANPGQLPRRPTNAAFISRLADGLTQIHD